MKETIENKNKFLYDLETVLDELSLAEEYLRMKIRNKEFNALNPSTSTKASGLQNLLEHAAYTINKYV